MAIPGLQNRIVNKAPASTLKQSASTGLKTAVKVNTFTRALGSQGSIFGPNGHVSARRTISPYDTQSLKLIRNSNLRESANAYAGRTTKFGFVSQQQATQQSSGIDPMSLMMIAGAVKAAAPSVMGLLNKAQASGNGVKGPDGIKQPTITSGNTYIDSMSNAQNSAELSTAISLAKEHLAELPDNIKAAKDELQELKGSTEELKQKHTDAKQALKKHTDSISTQKESVKSAKISAEQADRNLGQAKDDVTKATNNVSNLESQLLSASNEEKPAIEAQLTAARAQLAQAKAKQSEAEVAKEKADAMLERETNKLKELEAKTPELKKAEEDASKALTENLEDIEAKQKEVTGMEQEKTKLEKEIDKQEKALDKMQKSEKKELKELDDKIKKLEEKQSKLMDKINPNDSDKKDLKYKEEADQVGQQISELRARQTELRELGVSLE